MKWLTGIKLSPDSHTPQSTHTRLLFEIQLLSELKTHITRWSRNRQTKWAPR